MFVASMLMNLIEVLEKMASTSKVRACVCSLACLARHAFGQNID
jgi:hypothetical protein